MNEKTNVLFVLATVKIFNGITVELRCPLKYHISF